LYQKKKLVKIKIIFKIFFFCFLGNRTGLRAPIIGARRQHTSFSVNPRISFEDYLSTWRGIATSKANPNDENPLLNQLSLRPKLQAQHLALNANELGIISFERNVYIYILFF